MIAASSLTTFLAGEQFSSTDRHFANLMERLAGKDLPELVLASALVSRWLAEGHACLPLSQVAGRPYPQVTPDGSVQVQCPPQVQWEQLLRATSVVGQPGEVKPLILDDSGRLYLERYWRYERDVANDLTDRLRQPLAKIDLPALGSSLKRLFPAQPKPGEINWQKVAVFAAIRQRFCVITGGPGTGKTYTVARFLSALLEQPGGEACIVRVAAPTGKAVARLQESLWEATAGLQVADAIKEKLQDKNLTSTIHRLLGTLPNSPRFRHDADHPLLVDVLVVDEASMVGLSLMARLLAALKPDARLVLVGDKDQLPPVDPGSVLHDICQATASNRFSQSFRDDYQACSGESLGPADQTKPAGLIDAVVELSINYRAGNAKYLHTASLFLNAGEANAFLDLAHHPETNGSSVVWQELPRPEHLKTRLKEAVRQHYAPGIQAASAEDALRLFGEFRILCAVREGPYGCEALNGLVETILREDKIIPAAKPWAGNYQGKPIMVSANHYLLKVFNGDIGIIWPEGDHLLVWFPAEEGGLRSIARERLPAHETAYAMTVHKSQGSEFQHVLVILPERETPLLTRQLLYTGLTRAKQSVIILATETILRQAIAAQAQRASGLCQAIQ